MVDPQERGSAHPPQHRSILNLMATGERIMKGMREDALRKFDLSATDYALLVRLRDTGGQTAADLAREVFMTPQAVGQAVSRLEDRDYLTKSNDPTDGRRINISLTEQGRTTMAVAKLELDPIVRVMLSDLTNREILMLGYLLESVVGRLESLYGDPSLLESDGTSELKEATP